MFLVVLVVVVVLLSTFPFDVCAQCTLSNHSSGLFNTAQRQLRLHLQPDSMPEINAHRCRIVMRPSVHKTHLIWLIEGDYPNQQPSPPSSYAKTPQIYLPDCLSLLLGIAQLFADTVDAIN